MKKVIDKKKMPCYNTAIIKKVIDTMKHESMTNTRKVTTTQAKNKIKSCK